MKRSPFRPIALTTLTTMIALLTLAGHGSPTFAQAERDRPHAPGTPAPPTVFTRLAEAGTAKDHPKADYVIVLDQSTSRVEESGVTYVDLYSLTKVLTAAGAVARSVLTWPYDPRSSYVEVSSVNVVRDGQRIPVDLGGVKDLPAPQAAIYWADRFKSLQLPRLRVGDGVEVVTMRKGYNYALLADGEAGVEGASRVEGAGGAEAAAPAAEGTVAAIPTNPIVAAQSAGEPLPLGNAHERIRSADDDRYIPPMKGEYFDIVVMQADAPIVEKSYTVVLPASKRLISQEYNGALYTRTDYGPDSTRYTWWVKDLPALPHEPRAPGASDFAPKVVLTTAPSWEAKSRWFFDVNKSQFEVTDAIRTHVDGILKTAGLTAKSDPTRVATAINHWVAQNIRYSGQTMGQGEGFTLHPSNTLFEYRSGVCKDIASMSITLLRAAGLQTYPAMTMAGSRIEDIPADQFNHCVVAWEKAPGDFVMLDPTWVPYNNDMWSKRETEQQYLIGSPRGEHLNEIRYSPPEESPLRVRDTATLREDGTLAGTLRLEASGACDGNLRRFVSGTWKRGLDLAAATLLAKVSDRVRIVSVTRRAPADFSGDMWVAIDYEVPQYALKVGDALELRPAAANALKDHPGLFAAGSIEWPADRKTDVFLYNTQRLDITEEIRLPKGYKLAGPPRFPAVAETLAAFDGKAEQKGDTLTLTARADVKRRQIPPEFYGGFRKAIRALDDFAATTLRLTKGGA